MQFEELWLLEVTVATTVCESGWIPFWPLINDDPGHVLNFAPHGLSYDALLNELLRLFAQGDLIASHRDHDRKPSHPFVPSRQEIEASLQNGRGSPWLCYTATPQGLARWERYAVPDWSRYRTAASGGFGDLACATAGSHDVAQRWIWYLCEHLGTESVQWDRATYQIIRPWRILPSKTLEQGVQIIVPTVAVEPKPLDPTIDWCAREREAEKRMEGITSWYRHGVATWNADHGSR